MTKKKSVLLIGKLALTLAPAFIFLSTSFGQQLARSLEFNIPETDMGRSRRYIGGSVISPQCRITAGEKITALMPSQNVGAVGRTISKTPTLYVYVPENNYEIGEVVVFSEKEDRELYVAEFTPPSKPGITKHEIPASAGLEEGRQYQWGVTIFCDPMDRPENRFAQGNLLVVAEPTGLEEDLAAANNALEEASVYAKAQIWHDTVSSLVEVAEQYPEEWAELLESVGLSEKIARAEMLDCCTAKKIFFI